MIIKNKITIQYLWLCIAIFSDGILVFPKDVIYDMQILKKCNAYCDPYVIPYTTKDFSSKTNNLTIIIITSV
jgi:hypothetical protein